MTARVRSAAVAGAVVPFVSLGTWLAWFAWDTTRDLVPGTNDETGPYELWQGVGAAVTLVVLVSVATRWLSALPTALAVAVGFAAGFAWSGATDPESDGLYVIGTVLLLGTVLGPTFLLALAARHVREHRPRQQAGAARP